MNIALTPFFLALGFAFVFFALFLWRYPEARSGFFKDFFLFCLVIILGGGMIFQEAIGTKVLAYADGKIDQTEAQNFVTEKYGVTPLYSWYGFVDFQPGIIIQTKKNNIQQKIILNAFSGNPIDADIPATTTISFADFQARKTISTASASPLPSPEAVVSPLSDSQINIHISSPGDEPVMKNTNDQNAGQPVKVIVPQELPTQTPIPTPVPVDNSASIEAAAEQSRLDALARDRAAAIEKAQAAARARAVAQAQAQADALARSKAQAAAQAQADALARAQAQAAAQAAAQQPTPVPQTRTRAS
ncbi:MAG: hypothetical protein WCJ84_02050 [Candidatus Peregrinibacteria bacterium]